MTLLKEVRTGTIDLELIDGNIYLQFNCSCQDANPYCHAVCCRNRPNVNVLISDEDAEVYESTMTGPFRVLDWINGACSYLSGQGRCSIHKTKPIDCRDWHCSPMGVGENITNREKGWLLSSDNFKF
jgi:hypothetical protein